MCVFWDISLLFYGQALVILSLNKDQEVSFLKEFTFNVTVSLLLNQVQKEICQLCDKA